MKKNLLLITFLFFSFFNYTSAQRLLAPGNNWNLLDIFWTSSRTNNYSIGSDTIINGTTYQQLLRDGELVEFHNPTTPRFIRETEDGKVYIDNHIYLDTDEILIYDFGLTLMDTFLLVPSLNTNLENRFVVTAVDTIVLLDGSPRRQLTLELIDSQFNGTLIWIEGVGEKEFGPFYAHAFYVFDVVSDLLCAYQDEVVQVYQNSDYDSCFVTFTSVEELEINSPIKIYPNPVKDLLTLDLSETNQTFTEINIFNALGEMVYQQKVASSITEINTNQLNSGIYFLLLKDNSGTSYSHRLIKQ